MPIKWFSPNKNTSIVTIAHYGITFNYGAVEHLKKYKKILLGCDAENKILVFKPIKSEIEQGYEMFKKNQKTKNIRIGCKEFAKYIDSKFQLDLENQSIKFYIDIDEESEQMIVDLTKPIQSKKEEKK